MNLPYYGIIPARYASTRFPGKPLVYIAGKPMFWHVYQRAMRCGVLSSVTLATDDQRIVEAAQALNVPVVMTSAEHQSGTDRVFEAAQTLGVPDMAVVVNIQGDEPALDPEIITELVSPFADPLVRVSTVASVISPERAQVADQVKVVVDSHHNALYFSRAVIPFHRDAHTPDAPPFLGHIGLYAFRMEALRLFVSLPPSSLEKTEKLEQLRLLENGIPIRVIRTVRHAAGVDTPQDLERVAPLLHK